MNYSKKLDRADLKLLSIKQTGHVARTNRSFLFEQMSQKIILPNTPNLRMAYKHRTLQCEMVAANEKINVEGQEKRHTYMSEREDWKNGEKKTILQPEIGKLS